jgi:hypothetical protein
VTGLLPGAATAAWIPACDAHAEIAARLSDSYLFDGAPQVDVATLAQATTRRLVRGEHLWHPGGPANGVYVVHSGEVKDFLSTWTELRSFTSCTNRYDARRAGLLLGRACAQGRGHGGQRRSRDQARSS